MPLPSGTHLGRYEIRSLLDVGGMGEVYLAQDTQLRRSVAIKLLPAEFTTNKDRLRRFEREAYAASALNHPHILTIHESGFIDGLHFIVTEFVEGESLRRQLTHARMELREALDVAIQVASALAAAHEAGIIHRDIKPENIMVRRDGYVKVLDFGLAKLTRRQVEAIDTKAPTERLVRTEPGVVLGTVAYMSPEQARGLEVDERTDIWSLGVVLYEMVTGRLPFEGDTPSDAINSILAREPPPLARYSREAPEALEWIVSKALRKKRDERYQTTKELLTDLRRLKQRLEFEVELERSGQAGVKDRTTVRGVGQTAVEANSALEARPTSSAKRPITEIKRHKTSILLFLMILIVGTAIVSYFYLDLGNKKAIDSVAVLPFVNINADPQTEYLSDGISDSIINNLLQLPNLKVISLSSVLRYKGQKTDPQAVGRELNVRAVLMGRLTQHGDALSISTELVDVRDNHRIWGEQYNRKLSDLLTVQAEISREISEKLRLKLSSTERKQLTKRFTENAEAYQSYLKGRFYWNKYNEAGFRKAIEYFNQAIEKDPGYALAYAGLADSYAILGVDHVRPKGAFPQARAAAVKALELDDTLAEAHLSLGIYKLFYEWDWPGAERELKRAIELSPNNGDARHFYGHYLEAMGRTDEAIAETRRGLELDPLSLSVSAELGFAYYCAGQYDRAIEQQKKTLEMDPNFVLAIWLLGQAYERKGMQNEAITVLGKGRAISGEWPYLVAELGSAYAASGQKAEAQKILQDLRERAAREYIDPGLIALLYISLGEKDQAFEWLEKSYAERTQWMIWLKIEPKFESLRSDPRFTHLMQRVGLIS